MKKHERFRIAASTVLLTKKMWFPEHLKDTPDMVEFVSQIKGATHEQFTRADDGPDLISMAIVSMRVVYPSITANKIDDKLTDLKHSAWGEFEFEKPTKRIGGSTVF